MPKHNLRIYACRGLVAACIASGVLAAAGCTVGYYGLVGPQVTSLFLWLSIVTGLEWLATFWLTVFSLKYATRWLVILLGTLVCCGGSILAWCALVWLPMRAMRSPHWDPNNDVAVRSACHRDLIWAADPHDAFLYLRWSGDETSVPYILWAMRRMPPEDETECTWEHALEALRLITNHAGDSSRESWLQWYSANRRGTRIQWWADGFAAEGYPVSMAGGEASVKNLLSLLGRAPRVSRMRSPGFRGTPKECWPGRTKRKSDASSARCRTAARSSSAAVRRATLSSSIRCIASQCHRQPRRSFR